MLPKTNKTTYKQPTPQQNQQPLPIDPLGGKSPQSSPLERGSPCLLVLYGPVEDVVPVW